MEAANPATNPVTALIILILVVFLIWLFVKWMAFPVDVSKKLDALLKALGRTNELLEKLIPEETKPEPVLVLPPPARPPPRPVTSSCEHCGAEFVCPPDIETLTCPNCQSETRPQSPLRP
jgi:hypothetical protein